jgi:hypothetical protein
MHVVELGAEDDVVPLAVVAGETAKAAAVNRYFAADRPRRYLARGLEVAPVKFMSDVPKPPCAPA